MRIKYFVTSKQIFSVLNDTVTLLKWRETGFNHTGVVEPVAWQHGNGLVLTLPAFPITMVLPTTQAYELGVDCGIEHGGMTFSLPWHGDGSHPFMRVARKVKEYAYMVVGIYEDTDQRFADTYYAVSEMAAEQQATDEHPMLRVAAVFRVYEKDDDNIKRHELASSAQLLAGLGDVRCMELVK